MDYEQWLECVDKLFMTRYCGMKTDDFDDWLWWENYNFGFSPLDAYRKWAVETFK